MADFTKLRTLVLEGNLEENFTYFKQEVEIYFQVTETTKKSMEISIVRLLNLMVLKIYNTLKIEGKNSCMYNEKFRRILYLKKNEALNSYTLYKAKHHNLQVFLILSNPNSNTNILPT